MSSQVVQVREVVKTFGRVEAVRGVSFEVGAGEIFGFIGPNGSGKTTTIRTMLGFYKPDSGTVRVFGQEPRRAFGQIGPRIGIMLEQPGLHAHLTAREYLEFYGGLFELARREARARALELLELVGLSERAGHRLGTFSKGMRQRVTLARCLVNRPELLILDEPFDGIDAETRRDILQLIPRVAHDDGTAVFVTSHNLPEVERTCDRVAILHQGRIAACERTPELLRRKDRAYLQIRLSQPVPSETIHRILPEAVYDAEAAELRIDVAAHNGHTRDVALRALVENSISVRDMREVEASLEDVYFALTEAPGEQQ